MANGFCVTACACVSPDQRFNKGHVNSIDPNSHRRVLINLSDDEVKFVRDFPALCWPELRDLKKICAIHAIPR